MNKQLNSRQLRSEGGQAAVEFAFTITLTLLLVFGLIDFSRAIYSASVVQAAAQQGARTGLLKDATREDIVAATLAHMTGLDTAKARVTLTYPTVDIVQVDVTYEFEFILPLLTPIVGESLELSASASMVAQ